MKIDRNDRNFDRLISIATGERMKPERDRLLKSIENDIFKINKDLKTAETQDIKRMHEDKKKEYTEKLLKLKRRVNK